MDDLIFVVETGDVAEMLERVGLEDGGVAQKQLDESFVKYCDPYVPVGDSMVLLDSAYRSTEFGSGEIVWNTPYAHYMYEGILFVDPETGRVRSILPTMAFGADREFRKFQVIANWNITVVVCVVKSGQNVCGQIEAKTSFVK